MAKERRRTSASSKCRFCRAKVGTVDYKDIGALKKLVTPQGKMFSRKRSGNCAHHQRLAKRAIKLGRFMSLLPYIG